MTSLRERAIQAKSGSAVMALMDPVRGIRDQQRRQGVEPVNHAKQNRDKLKQIQEANRTKREDQMRRQSEEPFKMSRFKHVESKLANTLSSTQYQAQPEGPFEDEDDSLSEFVRNDGPRSHSRQNSFSHEQQQMTPHQPYQSKKVKTKPSVPRAEELQRTAQPAPVSNKNFISGNAREVIGTAPRRPGSREVSFTEKEDYGKVPQYILERKMERMEEEERRRREAAEAKLPPGMMLMEESDRLQTLALLDENLRKLNSDLGRFPLTVETESRKRAKAELENKIKEVEEAIKMFSKPKVYITK